TRPRQGPDRRRVATAPSARRAAGRSALSEFGRRYRAADGHGDRGGTMRRHLLSALAPLLVCLGLGVLWEAAARSLEISGLPPASAALRELPAILGDPEALLNIAASLRRMLTGFVLALGIAIPLGLSMARSRRFAASFNPLLMIIYPVPKAALMPIIMLWLGIGDASKTIVICLGVSLPVIYHSYYGA